jgi:predicted transcriptional regulator of viral defense system
MSSKLLKAKAFLKQHPMMTIADAKKIGISRHELKLWTDKGELFRLNRGVYSAIEPSDTPEQVVASIKKPCAIGGITALIYYMYTNVIKRKTWVLVPKGHPIINRPDVETMRQIPAVFKIGLVTIDSEWGPVQIVDREKAVLDAWRGRFLDIEEKYRMLKRYDQDPKKDYNRLLRYAKKMKVNTSFHDLLSFEVAER